MAFLRSIAGTQAQTCSFSRSGRTTVHESSNLSTSTSAPIAGTTSQCLTHFTSSRSRLGVSASLQFCLFLSSSLLPSIRSFHLQQPYAVVLNINTSFIRISHLVLSSRSLFPLPGRCVIALYLNRIAAVLLLSNPTENQSIRRGYHYL